MSKNCRLIDNEDKKCIGCITCLYKEDRRNRPWVYEPSLNQGFFGRDPVVEEEVEKEEVITLDYF